MVNVLPAQRRPAPVPGNPPLPGTRPEYGRVARILVAGNEAELQHVLWTRHYHVTGARSGREALTLSASRLPDAIVLDLALPDMSGIEVIAELRRWYRPPIIALSGATAVGAKISVLDAGADQYLTKPFAMDEFLARLRAALRRDSGNILRTQHRMVIGRWQVDVSAHKVVRADGAAASTAAARAPRLTATEWAILEQLLQHPGQLISPTWLMTSVWGPGFEQRTNYLRFHMTQLRRKLEDNPARPRYLLTEHGMGYRYQPPSRSFSRSLSGCASGLRTA